MDWAMENYVEEEYHRCYEELRSLGMPEVETGDHLRVHVLPPASTGYSGKVPFVLGKH